MNSKRHCGLGILVLAVCLLLGNSPAARRQPPRPEPGPAERDRLSKEIFHWQVKAAFQQLNRRWTEAIMVLHHLLTLHEQLYPKEQYPDGHAELARVLNNLGYLLFKHGDPAEAEHYLRAAVAMRQRLLPAEKHPNALSDLDDSLNNLCLLLEARGEAAEATRHAYTLLALRRQRYPEVKYPDGHPEVSVILNFLGNLLLQRGEWARGEFCHREALAICERLYPPAKYRMGHGDLIACLNTLGTMLQGRGELDKAEEYYRKAVTMCRQLYANPQYPASHPDLAASLNNLGHLLAAQGKMDLAEPCYREALALHRKFYPQDKYPAGHPYLTSVLTNLGSLELHRGRPDQAEPLYREALAMCERLYPPDKHPLGHSHLALGLHNLAIVLAGQGALDQAEPYYRASLAMRQRLYPRDKYPNGHPALADSFNVLGAMLHRRGDLKGAESNLHEALSLYQNAAGTFADQAAEADVLNMFATLPSTRDAYLGVTAQLPEMDAARVYSLLWQGKATLARSLQRRQRLFHSLTAGEDVRKLQEWLEVRRQLAALILATDAGKGHTQRLEELGARKEKLERELAQAIPELALQQARDRSTPAGLASQLPLRGAFVDFFRYQPWEAKAERWGEARFMAFVLLPGQAPRRVELGAAKPLEEALERWRKAIAAGRPEVEAPLQLRRGLWDKLGLPAETATVWICPDGELSALPWAALPGSHKSTLLEECAAALVPHGPLLIEQLSAPGRSAGGALLALGGVAYDQAAAVRKPHGDDALADVRAPTRAGKQGAWPALPGTERELAQVLALANRLPKPSKVVELRDRSAGPQQLLDELPQARWAHLATHGYFAAADSDERKHLYRPDDFLVGARGVRIGLAARHPLTQSGLVLAGANRPRKEGEAGGILTAEAIAGLPLDRLELAVLSACQTGLGEAAAGEGVFGLQRAFHLAGTRTVVASLWKVDDEATAALMAVFYHKMWVEKRSPLEALRQAQLALLRHPQEMPALAKERGPNFEVVVQRVDRPADPKVVNPAGMPPIKHWAAFVLSGAGR